MNYQEFSEPEPVVFVDGRSVHALGTGEICITILLGPKEKDKRKSTMTKLLYVPMLAANLFSDRAATRKGKVVQFGHTLCWINVSQGKGVAKGREHVVGIVWTAEKKDKKKQVSVAERSSDKLNMWRQGWLI
jgi:hypothetical protein